MKKILLRAFCLLLAVSAFGDTYLVISEYKDSPFFERLDFSPLTQLETGCLDVLFNSGQIVFTGGITEMNEDYPFVLNSGALRAAEAGGAQYLLYVRLNPSSEDLQAGVVDYLLADSRTQELIEQGVFDLESVSSSGGVEQLFYETGVRITELVMNESFAGVVW